MHGVRAAAPIGEPNGLEEFFERPACSGRRRPESSVEYDGTEGELYRVDDDPHQFRNLWDDPDYQVVRKDLVADLYDSLPPERSPKLKVERPA